MALRLDVHMDLICPWCLIGKHRLELALARRPHVRPMITWRPFLLNPDLPEQGLHLKGPQDRSLGAESRLQRMVHAVSMAAAQDGLELDLNRLTQVPNTVGAHTLVQAAVAEGFGSATVTALFSAYFDRGEDLSDPAVLLEAATRAGWQPDGEPWADPIQRQHIKTENGRAHRSGITGVPCFTFNEQFAISGAQEVDVLVRMIDLAESSDAETNRESKG